MSHLRTLAFCLVLALSVVSSAVVRPAMRAAGYSQNRLCKLKEISSLDSVPWPWGEEAEVPWEMLDGTWRVVSGNCQSLFSFETAGEELEPSARVLNVVQYNGKTCEKSSWGYGVEVNRVLQASMTTGKAAFNLTVRAFDHRLPSGQRARKASKASEERPDIVLTIYSRSGWHIRQSYELQKVGNAVKPPCQRAN